METLGWIRPITPMNWYFHKKLSTLNLIFFHLRLVKKYNDFKTSESQTTEDKYSSTMSSIFLFISWKLWCQGDFSFIGRVIGKVICHLIGLRCRSLRSQIFAHNQSASHFHTTSAGNLYRFMAPLYYHINIFFNAGRSLVHNCTIFLCSLDVRNDQCRGPSIKEKDHLVG